MAFNPFVWYCRPIANGYWDKVAQSALGSYTPCGVNTFVVPVSNVFLMCICIYRILLIKKSHKVHRYKLKSRGYHLILILLSGLSTAEPLFRIAFDISIFNAGEQPGLPPFEFVSLLMEGSAWASMVVLAFLETNVYIRECQMLMRFGIVYVLVGDAVMVNLILPMKDNIIGLSLCMHISGFICQVVVGALLLFHIPKLDPYPEYTRLQNETSDSYETLSGKEEVCPERHVNIFSWLFFEWMSPLMQLGYKRPITEKDVWKLDEWDRSEILSQKFHGCWMDQSIRPKPSLLSALKCSVGGRFWLGGIYKFGEALGRFVGPVILNLLLQSMQRGDPAWICCIYVFFMFSSSIFFLLIEGQFLQCVLRVGLRVRAILVSAIFRKSLRLTYEAHKNFPSGQIMNMISTDANMLQQICLQLHDAWSDPLQVIVSLALLYQQLGISSIIGSLLLVLMIPVQTLLIQKLWILTKEGLQFTDRRVSLMNEILVAMDTVKCRVWEDSFKKKIQSERKEELSWFRKSQLMFAVCNLTHLLERNTFHD